LCDRASCGGVGRECGVEHVGSAVLHGGGEPGQDRAGISGWKMEASVKKLLILLVILFGLGYVLLDKYILWMHEYEMPMDFK
jgi:hypothetical protein